MGFARRASIDLCCSFLIVVGLCLPRVSGAALVGTLVQLSPTFTQYGEGVDFRTFSEQNAATGDVTAPLDNPIIEVDMGCEASDFAGFSAGSIALIQRGTCVFSTKVNNAAAAGAIGALVFNNQSGPPPGGLFVEATTIPALLLTDTLGEFLLGQIGVGPIVIHLVVAEVSEPATVALFAIALAGLGFSCRKSALSVRYARRRRWFQPPQTSDIPVHARAPA